MTQAERVQAARATRRRSWWRIPVLLVGVAALLVLTARRPGVGWRNLVIVLPACLLGLLLLYALLIQFDRFWCRRRTRANGALTASASVSLADSRLKGPDWEMQRTRRTIAGLLTMDDHTLAWTASGGGRTSLAYRVPMAEVEGVSSVRRVISVLYPLIPMDTVCFEVQDGQLLTVNVTNPAPILREAARLGKIRT